MKHLPPRPNATSGRRSRRSQTPGCNEPRDRLRVGGESPPLIKTKRHIRPIVVAAWVTRQTVPTGIPQSVPLEGERLYLVRTVRRAATLETQKRQVSGRTRTPIEANEDALR